MRQQDSAWSGILKGKVAVVTGAARGIGRAAAVALAASGTDVAGVDICATVDPRSGVTPATKAELDETGTLVREAGGRWQSFVVDQRDLTTLRTAVVQVEHEFGGIDILFANAGIQAFRPLLEMEDADWHITIDVNLTGTANAIRAFAPAMVRRGSGRIIVTTSTQGRHGTLYGSAYSASKWGIIGLMKSAALELGKYKITVNALVPGLIDTPLTRHEERYAQALEVGGRTPTGNLQKDEEEAKKILQARSPLGVPWIDPSDLAPVVVFLASDAARMVSGSTYDVTGGDSANNAA
jgi:NAD(P)-dependent dehydrogenase (short-subunit alcohol dehydrogenase family)